jgi:RHS repeat-associated protein
VSFKYDPYGRRIQKSSATRTTDYAYDGDNIVEELNTAGTSAARYTQGLGIDEPLVMYRSGAASYYHTDGLGSIVALTNSTGFPVAAYLYDSFGDLTASAGRVTNPFRYTAREYDPKTKLYYYRARYYDPLFGRFLSEDPLRFQGGTNLYSYARNRPTSLVDPTGRVACYPVCFCRYESLFRRVLYVHR